MVEVPGINNQFLNMGSRMLAVCFTDEIHGWVVGYDGTILRTSAGNNLDALLLSGQEDLLLIAIGGVGIVIVLPIGRFVFRRRKGRMNTTHTGGDSKSAPEIL